MGRAQQLAGGVVGPAMQRADDAARDVATTLQHDRLAMPTHVAEQFDAVGVPNERLAIGHRFQRVVVAGVGHHEFVTDIAGSGVEHQYVSARRTAGSKYQPSGSWVGVRARAATLARSVMIPGGPPVS